MRQNNRYDEISSAGAVAQKTRQGSACGAIKALEKRAGVCYQILPPVFLPLRKVKICTPCKTLIRMM